MQVWNLNCFPVFFRPRFFFSITPPCLSPPRCPSLVALTRGSLWIFTRIEKPALRSARIVFLAPPVIGFLFFYSPRCYSLFIQPTFSTSAAPILTVLLSNWQPTLSLKCKKCFITMGPAKPLIMHGNMPVKTECIYFCGKSCCFGLFQGTFCRYLHYRVVFCQNLHNLKLYIFSHGDFFSFISWYHHMSQTFNMQIKHLMYRSASKVWSFLLIAFLTQIKHNISI